MLQSGSLIGFVPSTDLARARDFYELTLGLRLVEHNEYACVFDAHGWTTAPGTHRVGHRWH